MELLMRISTQGLSHQKVADTTQTEEKAAVCARKRCYETNGRFRCLDYRHERFGSRDWRVSLLSLMQI